MTLYNWIMIILIICKLCLLIPLILSIRESHAIIKRIEAKEKGQ